MSFEAKRLHCFGQVWFYILINREALGQPMSDLVSEKIDRRRHPEDRCNHDE